MNKVYPKFLFDSNKTKETRKIAQRALGEEDFYSSFLCRPFTIYISILIVKYTSIKANTITILMALISVFVPIMLYFVDVPMYFFLYTFLSYIFLLFLDVLDGEVARLRKETSETGVYIDSLLWYTLEALNMLFLLKINEFYFNYDWLIPVIFVLPFVKMFTINGWSKYITGRGNGTKTNALNFKYYLRSLLETPSLYLYFFIITAVHNFTDISLFFAITFLYILMFTMRVFNLTKKNIKILGVLK